jgi:hypothetical protein
MTAPTQNCGSCRWWQPKPYYIVGDCRHPVPDSATRFDEPMHPFEGTTCPTYDRREDNQE